MSAQAWIKFFPSDFIGGVRRLSVEGIAVYTMLLAEMWDRRKAVDLSREGDRRLFAGACGLSTRKFNAVLAELKGRGKIVEPAPGIYLNGRCNGIWSSTK